MTERSTDQQPKSYSELRHHASRLENENARLRQRTSNQRRELKRLNAKLTRMVDAFRATDQPLSREEAIAEASKMQRRARLAEKINVELNTMIAARLGAAAVTVRIVPESEENGKAAE
jgi:predicted RNase H-like nuclease (RuvC/YqgF family)